MMSGGEMGGGMWHWEGGASAKQALNSCINCYLGCSVLWISSLLLIGARQLTPEHCLLRACPVQ